MCSQADALRVLIEKVEEGCAPGVQIIAKRMASKARDVGQTFPAYSVEKAFHGSLDAAKALHEALLSGWDCTLSIGASHVCLSEPIGSDPVRGWYPGPEAEAENPARAWLLAIFKAYLSELENK